MKNVILFFICFINTAVFAEDIELYVKHNIDIDEKPRVMLIFDTSGSMAFSSRTGRDCGYDYRA